MSAATRLPSCEYLVGEHPAVRVQAVAAPQPGGRRVRCFRHPACAEHRRLNGWRYCRLRIPDGWQGVLPHRHLHRPWHSLPSSVLPRATVVRLPAAVSPARLCGGPLRLIQPRDCDTRTARGDPSGRRSHRPGGGCCLLPLPNPTTTSTNSTGAAHIPQRYRKPRIAGKPERADLPPSAGPSPRESTNAR